MSETPPPGSPRPPKTDSGAAAGGPGTPSSGWFARFLAFVEWLGNLLPHPVTLFALFAVGIVVVSGIAQWTGVEVIDPRPEGTPGRSESGMIAAKSLISGEGFRWMSTTLVTNFTGFVPLGTVLVALLGVGVAEKSGLLSAAIRGLILAAPKNLVTVVIVLAGILSNTASEMGYVVIIPLAAAIFHSLGRHPLAGLAAAFAGVSGGYSANLLIGTVDPLLSGITEEAARFVDPTYEVHPAVNWYFMAASTFFITFIGTWVTVKIVEPRLGKYDASIADEHVERDPNLEPLAAEERRGLRLAGLSCLACVVLFTWLAGLRFTDAVEVPRTLTAAEAGTDAPARATWQVVHELGSDARASLDARTAELRGVVDARTDEADAAAAALTEAMTRAEESGSPEDEAAVVAARVAADAARQAIGDASDELAVVRLPKTEGILGAWNGATLGLPGHGVLRDPDLGSLMPSPFLRSVVAMILVFFVVPGFVYGRVTGSMKGDRDVIDAMSDAMSSMGLYIVLVFFAAQFVAFFKWTNLGAILAVLGSEALVAMNLDNPAVFVPFILMCGFVNLMLGSASAQWAVTAPIFVPMLMKIGYSPEVIQAAYRIGDSSTNIITPMMSYFGLILAFATRYDRRLGIGTLVATMLPYSICFLVGWMVFFYVFVFVLGLPVGPGAPTTIGP